MTEHLITQDQQNNQEELLKLIQPIIEASVEKTVIQQRVLDKIMDDGTFDLSNVPTWYI